MCPNGDHDAHTGTYLDNHLVASELAPHLSPASKEVPDLLDCAMYHSIRGFARCQFEMRQSPTYALEKDPHVRTVRCHIIPSSLEALSFQRIGTVGPGREGLFRPYSPEFRTRWPQTIIHERGKSNPIAASRSGELPDRFRERDVSRVQMLEVSPQGKRWPRLKVSCISEAQAQSSRRSDLNILVAVHGEFSRRRRRACRAPAAGMWPPAG